MKILHKIAGMSRTSFIGFCILSTFLVIAIFAPFIAPYDPWEPGYPFLHPSLAHPLGTNDIGQDIFSELIYSARISLFIGFFTAFISMIIGTLIGLIAGFINGYWWWSPTRAVHLISSPRIRADGVLVRGTRACEDFGVMKYKKLIWITYFIHLCRC